MRPISIMTYGICLILLVIIGYSVFWLLIADSLKTNIETKLEALEYAVEKRGGQLNYGLVSVSGFPSALTVQINQFSTRYYKENTVVALTLPEPITVHRKINSSLITIQLPKLMQFQTQYATQKTATSYIFESSYSPQIQLKLSHDVNFNQIMPSWGEIEAALSHLKISTRDSNFSIQAGNVTLVYQHADSLSFEYARIPIEKNSNDQYQLKVALSGYKIQDAIDARWLNTLPYYRFFSNYFHSSQPLQAQCDLVIIGPQEWSNFLYQNSSYQVKQCEIQNQFGKISLSSQLAFLKSKTSPTQGKMLIELGNYQAMTQPLLNSVESTLALPILQAYMPPMVKPQEPLETYQRLFMQKFSELGRESDNGKNFSILLQFQDNKILLQDDSLQKKLPQVLSPLKAIHEMQQLFGKNSPTRSKADKAI